MDRRKVRFKGWVTVETFLYGDAEGSFVVMQRDEVTVPNLRCDDLLPMPNPRVRRCPGDSCGRR